MTQIEANPVEPARPERAFLCVRAARRVTERWQEMAKSAGIDELRATALIDLGTGRWPGQVIDFM
jgi:hypothetical protein